MLFFAAAFLAQDSRKDENPLSVRGEACEITGQERCVVSEWFGPAVSRAGSLLLSLTSDGKMACLSCEGGNASKSAFSERVLLQKSAPSLDPQTFLVGSSAVKVVKAGELVKLVRRFAAIVSSPV